ncbi:hypothetical protein M404DRAFT_138230 [Pisolithus tinctorius Marx 270]|uniref:Retrovirus-related Pol polyprotein from transposon TNT 1-94-like beta-barrel domain-containing protein n=1 Tax=Pisolithus tinctorius Marx 270 TaxID=870435 RepID=A0A0C3KAL6_PISTI|nr:hypothetical protein M404DRAFT_138230 [Pisolithus tinctorius Marx 270]
MTTTTSVSASATSASQAGSSVSAALSTGLTTFESVSVKIAAEAHCLIQQHSLSSVGSEYVNAATTSPSVGPPNVNLATGLHKTCNNPSGTYCDMPLGDSLVCGASNHDQVHCFKPGGGMASQRPAWQKGKGDNKDSTKPTTAVAVVPVPVPTTPPTAQPTQSTPVAAAVISLSSPWDTHPGDLTCAVITELTDDGDTTTHPSPTLQACLSTLSASSLLDSGTSHTLVHDRAFFRTYAADPSVNVQTANHGCLPTAGYGNCLAFLTIRGNRYQVHLTNCLHAPQAALHLVSVGWMLCQGWGCNFQGDPTRCELSHHGRPLGSVPLQSNNLCFLDLQFVCFDAPLPLTMTPVLSAFAQVLVTFDLWHA